MKAGKWAGLTMAALVVVPGELWSQSPVLEPFIPEDNKPVLRAQPVTRPLDPEPAAPKATPMPVATPIPMGKPGRTRVDRPKPAPVPPTLGQGPARATPIPAPEVADPGGEIRISPQGTMRQDQVQMGIADRFYLRKDFDQAAQEYERFLSLYPAAPDRGAALYRLGESYRALGVLNGAKATFDSLINQFPEGDLSAVASFRLAEIFYQEKNYASALPLYRRASVRLKDPKLVNSAKFFTGRCLEGLSQRLEARTVYEDLVSQSKDNPFYDAGRLSVALLLKEAKRPVEALRQVQALAKETANEELKAQAHVYAGLWELELDQNSRAEQDLKAALAMPSVGRWRDLAQLGLQQLYFRDKKYAEVVQSFSGADPKDYSPETFPQLMNLAAIAQRQLGKYSEAALLFDRVLKEFPKTTYAGEARYERLVCLYSSNAATLPEEIDQFLAADQDSPKRDQVILMKAEWLFKKQDYAAAAQVYAQVEGSRTLAASLKGEALSKVGWCYMQAKQFDKAVQAYTTLLEEYPSSKAVPTALCQRGLAQLRLSEMGEAVKDFDQLITRFPKAKERELALQQKALTQGQLNDKAGMAQSFKLLLKDYPNTPTSAAAEANYWIGWVAYEHKDYKAAVAPLTAARKLDKQEYFERASLRILLSYFYSEDKEALAREIEIYSSSGTKQPVPYEVLAWLGQGYFETASSTATVKSADQLEAYRNAAKYLGLVIQRNEAKPADHLNLGRSLLNIGDFPHAVDALEKYLALAKEPIPRVTGLLALGHARLGLKAFDEAQKATSEALSLQPDGELNARARILAGDIQQMRGNLPEAAKVYETVGVVIDDENITPQALEKAVEVYKLLGKEPDARRLLNTLQSRYPEYFQRKSQR